MPSPTTDLAAILDAVSRPGDFAMSGTIDLAPPVLEVEGVGRIALPLLPEQAERLVAVAERAPFGRGAETLVDTDVRRAWQFDPGRVRIEGAGWTRTLAAIVERACAGLGVGDPVAAEFYKLLLYRRGDFFVSHRDTEKVPGMFATLVIVLPSLSTGGELAVRHLGGEMRFDLVRADPAEIGFAAFYADCPHEVLPVTTGDRLTLVFNLVRSGKGKPPVAPNYDTELERVADLLEGWTRAAPADERDWPDKIVHPLDHAYSAAEIGFATLKGADAAVAAVLAKAAERSDCDIHLAQLLVEESGSAEHTGGWREEDSFEVGEVDNRSVMLTEWRRPDGSPTPLADIPVEEDDEISPPEALKDLAFDDEEFSEATGNEGASFERTYRRAALVLWPRSRSLAVLNQAGLGVTLPYLDDLIGGCLGSEGATREQLHAEARQLALHMLADWPERGWHAAGYSRPAWGNKMLSALTCLGDTGLIETFWQRVLSGAVIAREDVPVILAALHRFDAARAAGFLRDAVAGIVPVKFEPCCTLMAAVAADWPEIAREASKVILDEMPGDPSDPAMRDEWGRPRSFDMTFVADLLSALMRIDEALAERAVGTMLAWPEVYDIDDVLIPAALRLHAAPDLRASPAVERLRDVCAAHLRHETATEPAPPADLARASTLGCRCANCTQVATFLADPRRSSFTFKANQSERDHVEQTITRARADLGVTTVRGGRPYSLLCIKNRASYERAAARYRRNLDHLAAVTS